MQTAVATCDSLSVFMREMEKHPLLSKEEEYALAVRYYENEDLEAANKLVVSNLRFVVRIASEYKSYGFPMMDLVQEGSIGLMRAVKKFNPYKGLQAHILCRLVDQGKDPEPYNEVLEQREDRNHAVPEEAFPENRRGEAQTRDNCRSAWKTTT